MSLFGSDILKKLPILPEFWTSPAFWAGIIHGAEVAVEQASPDYTLAHHLAATVGKLLGQQNISTPTKQSAVPIAQAVAHGAQTTLHDLASAGVIGAQQQETPTK